MSKVKKLLDLSYQLIESVNMLMVVTMVIIISAQVFCRYFLGFTPGWTEEVSLLLLVWITSIGFTIGIYKGLHLSIELFVRNLPKTLKKIVYLVDEGIVIFFGYVTVRYGAELAMRMTSSTLPATQWSGSVLYIMVPISGVFMMIYGIKNMVYINEMIEIEMKAKEVL